MRKLESAVAFLVGVNSKHSKNSKFFWQKNHQELTYGTRALFRIHLAFSPNPEIRLSLRGQHLWDGSRALTSPRAHDPRRQRKHVSTRHKLDAPNGVRGRNSDRQPIREVRTTYLLKGLQGVIQLIFIWIENIGSLSVQQHRELIRPQGFF